jgi:hypothetical protein
MTGILAGLIASVKAGSAPAPTNIVLNPSFTTNITGWEGGGNTLRDTVNYRSAPASLNTYYDGDNIPYATYGLASALTVGQRYSLSFWIRNESVARTFRIEFAGSSTTTATIPASSSWQYLKFENVLATSTYMFITIYSPAGNITEFNIDDVSVVLGATALP